MIQQFESEIKVYVEKLRPEELAIRKKLDVGYSIEKQNLFIFEIRPGWKELPNGDHDFDYSKSIKMPSAKARFIKSKNIWKIYWHRASGKWDLYTPHPQVKKLSSFFAIIDADAYGCFWG